MDGLCAGKAVRLSSRQEDGLEPNSHPLRGRPLPVRHPSVRAVEAGRLSHPPGERLPRHRHDVGFTAVVLSGGYVEAGDTGWHRVAAGDVILHRAFESHLDAVDRRGAQVLVLPLPSRVVAATRGRFSDPDLLARLAADDAHAAAEALAEGFQVAAFADEDWPDEDWPDALARALLADPDLPIAAWARAAGLHPGSVARGFQQQFGVTAARFRATARAHRALAALEDLDLSLVQAAGDCGFADQAHMTRAIVALTGSTPHRLRRAAKELSA
jgi:AraC-like DNA-binding protein/quercetin dioxygenase-like cupin family protein